MPRHTLQATSIQRNWPLKTAAPDGLNAADLDRIEADFDESTLTQRIYSDSSETLFKQVEKLWST